MEAIGDWILRQLEDRGWTQAELARRAKIADATLSRIIAGTRDAGPESALAIAHALGEYPEKVYRLAGEGAGAEDEAQRARDDALVLALGGGRGLCRAADHGWHPAAEGRAAADRAVLGRGCAGDAEGVPAVGELVLDARRARHGDATAD